MPNSFYKTCNEAAIAAIENIIIKSIEENIEYSGFIYKDSNGYIYQNPIKGFEDCTFTFPDPLRFFSVVGHYHTHPDPLCPQIFSPQDLKANSICRKLFGNTFIAYVGTYQKNILIDNQGSISFHRTQGWR